MGNEIILALSACSSLTGAVISVCLLARTGKMSKRIEELEKSGAGETFLARQDLLAKTVEGGINGVRSDMSAFSMQTDQKLEFLRRGMESALTSIRRENAVQISEIKETVDKRLQDSLDKKLTDSFAQVSDRLQQVYKGL